MIQHFSFKPIFENIQIPGWTISFFYKQQRYNAEYKKDGSIVFIGATPATDDLTAVEKLVHELMLFHVYE
ncbi:YheE family protein [Solibacillus sp. FSL H8-0538]|uniref:YheE family protein n=1 Tax=Solibacillus sp. FSL H8-0538 TaxID=2921400 RepID=UPI0030F92163